MMKVTCEMSPAEWFPTVRSCWRRLKQTECAGTRQPVLGTSGVGWAREFVGRRMPKPLCGLSRWEIDAISNAPFERSA